MVVNKEVVGEVTSIIYCSRCKKKLTNPTSIDRGMGEVCWKKSGKKSGKRIKQLVLKEYEVEK